MDALLERSILLLDGGLGTTLEDQYGVKFSNQTPLWSSHLLLSHPDTLRKVQTDFVRSGANIILTPTYQASHWGLRNTKPDITDEEVAQCLQSGVNISRDVSRHAAMVALSLGAYGAILQPSQEYSGNYGINEEELTAFHRQRISVFDLSTVDLIAFETIPRLEEIRAVKHVVDGSKPYWISCVFPTNNKLPDGSSIEQVIQAMMDQPRPWGIGINCTKVQKCAALIEEFENAARTLNLELPRLVLYPDGTNGQVYDTTRQIWTGKQDAEGWWEGKVCEVVEETFRRRRWKGIVVGGCCKTTPAHIGRLRTRLDNLGLN